MISTICWEYPGFITKKGYGLYAHHRTSTLAHKAAYEAIHGPVPPGLELDHLCRNRACYNPTHLEPVTHAVNCQRGEVGRSPGSRTPRGWARGMD